MHSTPSGGDGPDGSALVVFGVTLTLIVLPAMVACAALAVVTGSETLRLVGAGSAAATARFATAFGVLVLAMLALVGSAWRALRSFRREQQPLSCLRWPLLALAPVALGMVTTVWAVQP